MKQMQDEGKGRLGSRDDEFGGDDARVETDLRTISVEFKAAEEIEAAQRTHRGRGGRRRRSRCRGAEQATVVAVAGGEGRPRGQQAEGGHRAG